MFIAKKHEKIALAKVLHEARQEALILLFPDSEKTTWSKLGTYERSVLINQAAILLTSSEIRSLDSLMDDEDLMFKMGCIENEIVKPDKISKTLKATVIGIAKGEILALVQAIKESE